MRFLQSKVLVLWLLAGGFFVPVTVAGHSVPPGAPAPSEIVNRYLHAIAEEKAQPQDLTMDVDIDAQLPRLKKSGKLHGLRFVSRLGRIVYRGLRFEGDDTIKKQVIARYLEAENEAEKSNHDSMAVTPENYKFSYKGTADYAGKRAYVFKVKPRHKRRGLYEGELWVDSQTYLPLREWGEFVKNPSLFVKNVYFVRDYYLYQGRAVPRRIISAVSTRLVGKAKLTIWFDNFSLGKPAGVDSTNVD
jgi:MucB/RseB N-terminal domain